VSTYDIMVNLFKRYKSFGQCKQNIVQKIKEYDEGSQITEERLMILEVNLFKRYKSLGQCKQNIVQKIKEYDEGSQITEERLMILEVSKYKTFVRAGEWQVPTKDQKEILVIWAQKWTI